MHSLHVEYPYLYIRRMWIAFVISHFVSYLFSSQSRSLILEVRNDAEDVFNSKKAAAEDEENELDVAAWTMLSTGEVPEEFKVSRGVGLRVSAGEDLVFDIKMYIWKATVLQKICL